MITDPVIGDARYSAGVEQVLRQAAALWAGVMPAAQFVAFLGSQAAFEHHFLIWSVFMVHAACWVATVPRHRSVWAPILSWTLIAVVLAVSANFTDTAAPRLVLNVSMTVAIAAALLFVTPLAAVAAATVFSAVGLVLLAATQLHGGTIDFANESMTLYYALVIPVYTVASTAAVAIVARGLRDVADAAEGHQASRLRAERNAVREMVSVELVGRRSRVLHDTVVNTLGAIAGGGIVSDPLLVSSRCSSDIAAINDLERLRIPAAATLPEVISYARALDIEVVVDDQPELEALLVAQPPWRRSELLGIIGESITNAAKHSGADRVRIEASRDSGEVRIRDDGSGSADTSELDDALLLRAQDALIEVGVESGIETGTTVSVSIPPLETVDGQSVLTRAVGDIASRLVPVLLLEFLVIGVIATSLQTGWSARGLAPAAAVWLTVAAILWTLTRWGRREPHVPHRAVAWVYTGMVVAGLIVVFSPGIVGTPSGGGAVTPANLAWVGDAAAGICIALILVDGRMTVVLPPVVLSGFTVFGAIVLSGGASGSILATLFADALLIAVFLVIRRRLSLLATEIERQHRTELLRREEIERCAAAERFHLVESDTMFARAKAVLAEVAQRPWRADAPEVQAQARREEHCLRALLAIEAGHDPVWVTIIGAARSADILLELRFFTTRTELAPAERAELVAQVVAVVHRCLAGETVTVAVFADGSAVCVDVVAESVPGGIVELRGGELNGAVGDR